MKKQKPPGGGRRRHVGTLFWTDKDGNLKQRSGVEYYEPFDALELLQAQDAAIRGTMGTMRQDRKPATPTVLAEDLSSHRMLSEKEAAAVLGVHYKTLRKMSAEGKGPRRIKVSEKRVGYRLRDCRAYIDERAALSGAPQPTQPPLRRRRAKRREPPPEPGA